MDLSIQAGWLGSAGGQIHPPKKAETASNNIKIYLKQ